MSAGNSDRKIYVYLGEAKPGGFQTGGFPLFLGQVQIVSRTLSGLFLGTNRENPRTIPEQIGKIPEKSGKSQKGQKGQKRKDKSKSGNPPPPRLKPPRLAALDLYMIFLSERVCVCVSMILYISYQGVASKALVLWTAALATQCTSGTVEAYRPSMKPLIRCELLLRLQRAWLVPSNRQDKHV